MRNKWPEQNVHNRQRKSIQECNEANKRKAKTIGKDQRRFVLGLQDQSNQKENSSVEKQRHVVYLDWIIWSIIDIEKESRGTKHIISSYFGQVCINIKYIA